MRTTRFGEAPPSAVSLDNPLAGDPNSVEEGKKLFTQMNCAGCHGYDAKGGMGPDLTDTEWRYGGTPIDIYKSIYEGRAQGMPAWGNTLPTTPIWQEFPASAPVKKPGFDPAWG